MKDITLKSGNAYSLSELFSEDRKIIIPDMQRDYCWGDNLYGANKNEDLVTKFLESLLDVFSENKENKEVQLGMIYAYESPDNHIQLCDGQQRITTLYLLMGLLHKKTNNNSLKDCLISTFEWENDDKECRLQYAIRESTLYFLNDLVDNCFIKKQEISVIKKQSWYFNDYDLDPTIQSMIKALGIIEKQLANKTPQYLDDFSTFLMGNLTFLYFDMQNRNRGEDMFVIINTTGEPLTPTDNLKPILLSDFNDPKFSDEWEKRETYFWKNKKQNEVEADNGVNNFLTWYLKIVKQDDKFELIHFFKNQTKEEKEKALTEIEKYFNKIPVLIKALQSNVFKSITIKKQGVNVNTIQDLRSFNKDHAIEEYIVLPLLAFIVKFENEVDAYQFLRRLRKNYWLSDSEFLHWRYILRIIEKSESLNEILEFDSNSLDEIKNINIGIWYNDEEKIKTKLKKEHQEAIELWEDHEDFKGDLSALFKALLVSEQDDSITSFNSASIHLSDFDELKRIYTNISKLSSVLKAANMQVVNHTLSNWYRLFLLYSDCNKIGHIPNASWDFQGVLFSNNNDERLKKVEFYKLCKQSSELFIDYIEDYIKSKSSKEQVLNCETSFEVNQFIKIWLLLKVLNANKHKALISFHNGSGIAAYNDCHCNRININLPFSLGNAICGYGEKSGGGGGNKVSYAKPEWWLKSGVIDTPFSSINYDDFQNRLKQEGEKQDYWRNLINENHNYILELINAFY